LNCEGDTVLLKTTLTLNRKFDLSSERSFQYDRRIKPKVFYPNNIKEKKWLSNP